MRKFWASRGSAIENCFDTGGTKEVAHTLIMNEFGLASFKVLRNSAEGHVGIKALLDMHTRSTFGHDATDEKKFERHSFYKAAFRDFRPRPLPAHSMVELEMSMLAHYPKLKTDPNSKVIWAHMMGENKEVWRQDILDAASQEREDRSRLFADALLVKRSEEAASLLKTRASTDNEWGMF